MSEGPIAREDRISPAIGSCYDNAVDDDELEARVRGAHDVCRAKKKAEVNVGQSVGVQVPTLTPRSPPGQIACLPTLVRDRRPVAQDPLG